jgi:hypothetical protein
MGKFPNQDFALLSLSHRERGAGGKKREPRAALLINRE